MCSKVVNDSPGAGVPNLPSFGFIRVTWEFINHVDCLTLMLAQYGVRSGSLSSWMTLMLSESLMPDVCMKRERSRSVMSDSLRPHGL